MHGTRSSAHTAVCIPLYLLERIPVPMILGLGWPQESVWTFMGREKCSVPTWIQTLNCSACSLVSILIVLFQVVYLV